MPPAQPAPESAAQEPPAAASETRRPQFGLRALLAVVAALGALFAVMDWVGLPWSLLVAWFTILASAHVAANAWGTRRCGRGGQAGETSEPRRFSAAGLPPPQATRLRENTRPGRKMVAATISGSLVGGTAGTLVLAGSSLVSAGVGGVALGGFSSAVVGGFLGFLTSSFVEVAAGAVREASVPEPSRPR